MLAETRSTAQPTSTCAASASRMQLARERRLEQVFVPRTPSRSSIANIAFPLLSIHRQEITPLHTVIERSRKYLHSSHIPATHTLRPAYLVLDYWAESQPKLAPDRLSISGPPLPSNPSMDSRWRHGLTNVKHTHKLNAGMGLIH